MSKKTRYFVLSAAGFMAVGLTTGLVASYMGLSVPVLSREAAPQGFENIPQNAAVVAFVNVKDIANSAFRERFRKLEPDTQERDEFEKQTGINIDHDIDSVIAAVIPAADGSAGFNPETGVVVVARGRFEQGRLESLALEHGATVEEYGGKRLLTHANQQAGKREMAVAFLGPDLVALGGYGAVKSAIDAAGGDNILSNTELMKQVSELESSNAWAVGRFDAIANQAHIPNEIKQHVPAIQWFSAATHVNGGVSGVIKAETRDDEAAQNLRDILRGALGLAKMHAASKPEFKAVVDSLQLSGDGKTVAVSFTVPAEVLDVLEAMGKKYHGELEHK